MTRINFVNMHKEIGAAPDSFLKQQTLSVIMMKKGDDDEGAGEGGWKENKAFLDKSTSPLTVFYTVLGSPLSKAQTTYRTLLLPPPYSHYTVSFSRAKIIICTSEFLLFGTNSPSNKS